MWRPIWVFYYEFFMFCGLWNFYPNMFKLNLISTLKTSSNHTNETLFLIVISVVYLSLFIYLNIGPWTHVCFILIKVTLAFFEPPAHAFTFYDIHVLWEGRILILDAIYRTEHAFSIQLARLLLAWTNPWYY